MQLILCGISHIKLMDTEIAKQSNNEPADIDKWLIV